MSFRYSLHDMSLLDPLTKENYIGFNKEVMIKLAKVKYENDSISKKELEYVEAILLEDIQKQI